jgi:UDP-N-acetylglucosamine--N-acetylmuramyl-(pentapeptide) pyrophosphoryl-undecaprenol N-acetylglucosamine transferase
MRGVRVKMPNRKEKPEKPFKILLAAGGTGGHILPAVVFGRWIGRNRADTKVSYMSGRRSIELEIYRSLKIEPFIIDVEGSPLGAQRGERLRRWKDLFRSFRQAQKRLRQAPPDLCVAFGGYVSAAAVLSAYARKVPTVAHEQNALAGKVTLLARALGAKVASGWNKCDPLKEGRFVPVGVPVRPLDGMSHERALSKLGLDRLGGDGPTVAVMTGSLGSGKLAEVMSGISGKSEFVSWNFLIIDPDAVRPLRVAPNTFRLPRSWDVAPLFNLADILVTRGGASTLAEAGASGIPAIVAPWRRASCDHQMKNALEMAKGGSVEIFDETADGAAELAAKLINLRHRCPPAERDIGKKMYNASINTCERLWDFCRAFLEGRD